MKAYSNIEFLIAGSVFIGLAVYAGIVVGSMHADSISRSVSDISMSRSYRLFYSMFFSRGYPEDWTDPESAEEIGFMESPWKINSTKLGAFMDYCDSSYIALVQKLGRPFYVRVGGRECGPPMESTTRVMSMDGIPVAVEVGAQ